MTSHKYISMSIVHSIALQCTCVWPECFNYVLYTQPVVRTRGTPPGCLPRNHEIRYLLYYTEYIYFLSRRRKKVYFLRRSGKIMKKDYSENEHGTPQLHSECISQMYCVLYTIITRIGFWRENLFRHFCP